MTQEVEVIKEKIIEVPVEKKIEVEVEVIVEKPVYRENIIEQEVVVETEVHEFNEENVASHRNEEYEDEELATEIVSRQQEVSENRQNNQELQMRLQELTRELNSMKSSQFVRYEEENQKLRIRLNELTLKLRQANESKSRLVRKSLKVGSQTSETVLKVNPRVNQLKDQLKRLISMNNQLISQISNKGETLRKSLRRSNNA